VRTIRVLLFPVGEPPVEKTISATGEAVAALIGAPYWDRVRVSERCHLYVDDEGLIRDPPALPNVWPPSYPQPLHGNAVLAAEAMGDDGETDFTDLTDDEIAKARTSFLRVVTE
jgi:hypothetical protein